MLQQAYGGTELGPAVTGMPRDAVADRPASCGRAVPYTHVRLVTADGDDAATGEVGEVWIKGPSVTPGYWRKDGPVEPARTDDGWFRTGDAARRDADGFYYLVDRVKDMYKSGGENVAPGRGRTRDSITHPDVLDVAVVGVPDPTWGEVGRAFVVVRPGTTVTLDELREFCAGTDRPVQGAPQPRRRRRPAAQLDRQGLQGRAAQLTPQAAEPRRAPRSAPAPRR